MYSKANVDKDPDATSEDLAEATAEEIFKSVNSQESDAQIQTTNCQLSAPGDSYASDVEVAPEPEQGSESDQNMRLPHTGIYAIKSRSSFFHCIHFRRNRRK